MITAKTIVKTTVNLAATISTHSAVRRIALDDDPGVCPDHGEGGCDCRKIMIQSRNERITSVVLQVTRIKIMIVLMKMELIVQL